MNDQNILLIAEGLRQEPDWHKIRIFLADLCDGTLSPDEETFVGLYSFFREMLRHPKGAARRQAAFTMGALLKKTGDQLLPIWESSLRLLLFADLRQDEVLNRWSGYCLLQIVNAAMESLPEEKQRLLLTQYASWFKSVRWQPATCESLLCGILDLSPKQFSPLQRHEIFGFIRSFLSGSENSIITASLLLLRRWQQNGWTPQEDEQNYLAQITLPADAPFCQRYLLARLTKRPLPEDVSSRQLMLKDLKLDADWSEKLAHADILRERVQARTPDTKAQAMQEYAAHMLDILRLSSHPMVFMGAGEALLRILSGLSDHQSNEIIEEILNELSLGIDTSNYAAQFLGRAFFSLAKEQQHDISKRLISLSDKADPSIAKTALETIAVLLWHGQSQKQEIADISRIAGALRKARVSFLPEVSDEASFLIRHYGLTDLFKAEKTSEKTDIAFFSDGFDPFTLRDKAIIRELLEMDFHVVLAINDFGWQRNSQPYHIRRQMTELSIADLPGVELLSEELSINMSNARDREALALMYPGRRIFNVVRSEAIETNAEQAVSGLPHIICENDGLQGSAYENAIRQLIGAETVFLRLPAAYQEITEAAVMERIREKHDLSGLVDTQVQNFIRANHLYADGPLYRKRALTRWIDVSVNGDSAAVWAEANGRYYKASVKWKTAGKTAVILEIEGDVTNDEDYRNLALTEAMALCQQRGLTHIACFDADRYRELLLPFGFVPMKEYENGLTVDMSQVIVLFLDSPSVLRDPYNSDPRIRSVIRENRKRLLSVLTSIYPGMLVLGLQTDLLNDRMIRLIRANNPGADKVCVPFGKILKGVLIPNTVTWDLRAEKHYRDDLSSFDIRALPHYPSLTAQIRGVKSLDKEVLLVDDLFHNGYRFHKIARVMEQEGMEAAHVITGIISGQGAELAAKNGISIESVYSIPNMKVWLLESDLYPFVGGDGIQSEAGDLTYGAALPSINTILPYEMPGFFKDAPPGRIYALSDICLHNAKELFLALEEVYQEDHHHPLTAEQLSSVIAEPRYPAELSPEGIAGSRVSLLLEKELRRLMRLKHY